MPLDLEYSAAQAEMLFGEGRFRGYPKGRRLGFTRGAAHAHIEWMLEGDPCLWGDTIVSNIRRYVERYFLPVLRLNGIPYAWNVQEKMLKLPDSGGYTDFRSADNPMNWEGFGYKRITLNEAGIILQGENGRYIYENAVMPMMLDYPESELVAAGAPKGKLGKFYDLHRAALEGVEGHATATFTSYDNPWLRRAAIERLEADMLRAGGQILVDQEIYGRFVDGDGDEAKVIPRAWLDAAVGRWRARERKPTGKPDQVGGDVARGGDDRNAFASRWGMHIGELKTTPGSSTPTGAAYAAQLMPMLGPQTDVFLDATGIGASAYDHALAYFPRVRAFLPGNKTRERDSTGVLPFANLRALAYWRVREALDPDREGPRLELPPNEQLLAELNAPTWRLTAAGVLIEPKEKLKERLGRSPDLADAVTYALIPAGTIAADDHDW